MLIKKQTDDSPSEKDHMERGEGCVRVCVWTKHRDAAAVFGLNFKEPWSGLFEQEDQSKSSKHFF